MWSVCPQVALTFLKHLGSEMADELGLDGLSVEHRDNRMWVLGKASHLESEDLGFAFLLIDSLL